MANARDRSIAAAEALFNAIKKNPLIAEDIMPVLLEKNDVLLIFLKKNNKGDSLLAFSLKFLDGSKRYLIPKLLDALEQQYVEISSMKNDEKQRSLLKKINEIIFFETSEKQSLLHLALFANDIVALKRIIALMKRLDSRKYISYFSKIDEQGNTSLHVSAQAKYPDFLPFESKLRDDNYTLRYFLEVMQTELPLSQFVSHLNQTNECGNTPFHTAIESKKFKAAVLLVMKGADDSVFNNNEETPFDQLSKLGKVDLTLFLREFNDIFRDFLEHPALYRLNKEFHNKLIDLAIQHLSFEWDTAQNFRQKNESMNECDSQCIDIIFLNNRMKHMHKHSSVAGIHFLEMDQNDDDEKINHYLFINEDRKQLIELIRMSEERVKYIEQLQQVDLGKRIASILIPLLWTSFWVLVLAEVMGCQIFPDIVNGTDSDNDEQQQKDRLALFALSVFVLIPLFLGNLFYFRYGFLNLCEKKKNLEPDILKKLLKELNAFLLQVESNDLQSIPSDHEELIESLEKEVQSLRRSRRSADECITICKNIVVILSTLSRNLNIGKYPEGMLVHHSVFAAINKKMFASSNKAFLNSSHQEEVSIQMGNSSSSRTVPILLSDCSDSESYDDEEKKLFYSRSDDDEERRPLLNHV